MILDFPVKIERKTLGVSERGFGTILIYDSELVMDYTILLPETLEELLEKDSRTYKLAQKLFMQSPSPQEVAVFGGEDIAEVAHKDFFFIVSPDNSIETIEELATFAAVNDKMYAFTFTDIELAEQISELENENTIAMYHDDKEAFAGEALAVVMSYNVGGKTGKFKNLVGVKEAKLTATELKELTDLDINTYVRKLGVLQTTEGLTTSGEYIDVKLGEYWIRFRMEERLHHLALNNDKIPYTNQGIGMMVGVVESVLKEASDRGILIEGQYIVDYKRREEVSSNEVANRDYSHIRWAATLAGAIHTGTIYGVLTNDMVRGDE